MTSSAGRPRDPDVDRRVATAAVQVFGEVGWSGFSVDEVSRRAKVGKASIYRRWSSGAELLVDAVRETVQLVPAPRGADLAADLRSLGGHLLDAHAPDNGRSMLRLRFEAADVPGLSEHWNAIRDSEVAAARQLVHNAVRRGELPRRTNVTMVLDALCGAVLMHAIARPEAAGALGAAERNDFLDELVRFVLAGIHGSGN